MDFDEEKPGSTWLPAVSLGQVQANYFMVKYKSSGSDGEECHEKLVVRIERIRPRPPQIEKKSFELLEKVEALRGSRWSVGLITRILEDQRYTVTFRHEKRVLDFDRTDLRPYLDWRNGKWVTNYEGFHFTSGCQEQSSPVCNKVGSCEIVKLDKTSRSLNESLYSSTKEVGEKGTSRLIQKQDDQEESSPVDKSPYFEISNKYKVNHSSNGDNSAEVELIRDHEINMQQEVGDTENHAIVSAERKNTLLDSQITVSWPGKCKRKRLSKAKFQNLQSSNTVKEAGVIEAAGKESLEPNDPTNEECEMSNLVMEPKEVMDSHVENSSQPPTKKCDNAWISCSIIRKSENRESRPSNLLTTEVTGNEISEEVVTVADYTTEKFKSPITTRLKSADEQAQVSLISKNGSSPAIHAEETNSLTNIGDVGPHLPFAKLSPLWQFLESTEVFKKSPQKPHFRPLLNHQERRREGTAIGHMVNFSNLIENIYQLQENDSREDIDELLKMLAEFEELGFDVTVFQDLLNEMRATKVEYEKLQDGLKRVKSEINKCTDEMTKVDKEVTEIDNAIEKIKRKLAESISKREELQSKVIKLMSEGAVIDASLSCARESLRSLVMAPR